MIVKHVKVDGKPKYESRADFVRIAVEDLWKEEMADSEELTGLINMYCDPLADELAKNDKTSPDALPPEVAAFYRKITENKQQIQKA